jgi:hypothetical protein
MHPDNVIATQQLVELAGKLLVHSEIGGSVAFRQVREVEAIMTNRPKRPVGEATIILFDIAARKAAYRKADRSISSYLRDGFAFLASFARPAEPKSTAWLERCFKRNGKSARRGRSGHAI